jgi:UDPglucose 6-dehydrogenase
MAILAKTRKEYFLIVIKSTVIPTTTEDIIIPLIENYSGKKAGQDFGVCVNPEFVREREALSGENPDRIVIGQYDSRSGDLLEKVYSDISSPIIRTDIRTAEMIKYANNCFYAAKISFFNEIHMVCTKLGIDSHTVRRAVQMDKYYSTHPWEHGNAFGGKCLPKDLQAFISFCTDSAVCHTPVLLNSVQQVNEMMKEKQD